MSTQAYIVTEGRLVREKWGGRVVWNTGEEDEPQRFGPVADLAEARREYDARDPRGTFELERSARGGIRRMAGEGYWTSIERVEVGDDGEIEYVDTVDSKRWSCDDQRAEESD